MYLNLKSVFAQVLADGGYILDADLARRIWEQVDALGTMYIWQLLLSS